ncbi:hypothetical protein RM549_06180 [Salegentibacter sp. F188]|uniref:Uncharacterized protein n=1 Tax=Autumnicola patrickiae TaxID=3075591 RepID=A0ABU3E0C0_9FLAO|nr:hypothetical protein [Salegentibacter sp. F188]MDT0689365.1 hypothetical protein [Salegentibacter sp. F188]
MSCISAIVRRLEVAAIGPVADALKIVLEGDIETTYKADANILDVSASEDMEIWFNKIFSSWFSSLTARLTVADDFKVLTANDFTQELNQVIEALEVARAYYAQQANFEIISSLENVALQKAAICEIAAKAVVTAYEVALNTYGSEFTGREWVSIQANFFEGSTPEPYQWQKKNIIVNLINFNNVAVENSENQEQPVQTRVPQYLPWVFTAAFGIIAWSAASKK